MNPGAEQALVGGADAVGSSPGGHPRLNVRGQALVGGADAVGSSPDVERTLVGGVDAARGGWVMAITGIVRGSPVEFSVRGSFGEVWAEARAREVVALGVDMPIGLAGTERRQSDVEARRMLGPRRSSLFFTPPLVTLDAADHDEANHLSRIRTGRGLSIQAFNLLVKVREVRASLTPDDLGTRARPRAAEVHPETSLAVLAGRPMAVPKRQPSGQDERLAVLAPEFSNLEAAVRPLLPGSAIDDLLDATAAAWTARRLATGTALLLGSDEVDETGYPMTICA